MVCRVDPFKSGRNRRRTEGTQPSVTDGVVYFPGEDKKHNWELYAFTLKND